jgi:3-phenylpropionate/trans-cinnamate dioxygenase ferredoxin subunit
MGEWVRACAVEDVEPEDLVRFDHDGRTFCVYRSPEGDFYCTDGFCTHGRVHLSRGLVMGHVVECPGHNGQFDYRTGEPRRTPACEALRTYPARVDGEAVFVSID